MKPLKDWTLEEVRKFCAEAYSCQNCPFRVSMVGCAFEVWERNPTYWVDLKGWDKE